MTVTWKGFLRRVPIPKPSSLSMAQAVLEKTATQSISQALEQNERD
jgi:hypothetical protein